MLGVSLGHQIPIQRGNYISYLSPLFPSTWHMGNRPGYAFHVHIFVTADFLLVGKIKVFLK